MADMVFWEAEAVRDLATALINVEAEFESLQKATIVYCFRDREQKRDGKIVYATTAIVGGKNAWLYWSAKKANNKGKFFLVTVDSNIWEMLKENERSWLVRHELRHCWITIKKGVERLNIRPHDFELFFADIHDPVMDQVCLVIEAAKQAQLRLDMEG